MRIFLVLALLVPVRMAAQQSEARVRVGVDLGGKGGVDAKVGLTPTLTADLTLNTDFAQVEVDQQIINLTRFPFFFPAVRSLGRPLNGAFVVKVVHRIAP